MKRSEFLAKLEEQLKIKWGWSYKLKVPTKDLDYILQTIEKLGMVPKFPDPYNNTWEKELPKPKKGK